MHISAGVIFLRRTPLPRSKKQSKTKQAPTFSQVCTAALVQLGSFAAKLGESFRAESRASLPMLFRKLRDKSRYWMGRHTAQCCAVLHDLGSSLKEWEFHRTNVSIRSSIWDRERVRYIFIEPLSALRKAAWVVSSMQAVWVNLTTGRKIPTQT
jgi:hypothetical protein